MPDAFAPQSSENHHDRHQSPKIHDTDRHTPMPHEHSNKRKPEVYYMGAKNDHEPIHDKRPNKPSSPPINNSFPSSHGVPELYHLKVGDNHSEPIHHEQPHKPSSPPINHFHPSTGNGPEMYHLKIGDDNNIHDRRPSPALVSNNRVSPVPHHVSNGHGPEMYYLQVGDVNRRQSPPINKTKFNDNITHDENHGQQKITMYMLAAPDQENLPSSLHIQRTPSPPIRPTKKQEPISYDVVDNNKKFDIPNKQRPFPTALHDVPINIRYVPLSQSKASESIQRSMNKYRFGGS